MKTKATENKRKNKRLSCCVPIDGKQGKDFYETQTVDFSKEGLGLISPNKVPIDKEIVVELNLEENDKPVLVVGQVKWVKPVDGSTHYRIGLHFKDVLHGSKSRLTKYFRK